MKMLRCRKLILAVSCIIIFGVLCSCAPKNTINDKASERKKYNIAVISSGKDNEDFSSFFNSVSDTFRNIGYKTDKFSANDNSEYLNDILNSSLEGGYIGVILYDSNAIADEFAKKASEAGIFTLVFSSGFYENPQAITVLYDQKQMTIDSINALVAFAAWGGDNKPKIVKVWHDRNDLSTSAKEKAFNDYVTAAKIDVAVEICEETLRTERGLSRATKTAISNLPDLGFNYIWVCDDEMAELVINELDKESIQNAIVVSASMSPSGIKNMQELSSYWYASSLVSFKNAGVICADVLSGCIENKAVSKVTNVATRIVYGEEIKNLEKEELEEKLGI